MSEEKSLISKLQEGNSRVLSKLYDDYAGALYGVIIRICKNESQAQDVLQETFVKIWENANKYDPGKGKFYTWAYRIARNTSLNALRNPSPLIQSDDLSVYSNKAEQEEEKINLQELKGSLKQLDAHHQKALELIYFQGLTHREAHKEMDVPLGTFKSYVQQALKKLRDAYQLSLWVVCVLMEWII